MQAGPILRSYDKILSNINCGSFIKPFTKHVYHFKKFRTTILAFWTYIILWEWIKCHEYLQKAFIYHTNLIPNSSYLYQQLVFMAHMCTVTNRPYLYIVCLWVSNCIMFTTALCFIISPDLMMVIKPDCLHWFRGVFTGLFWYFIH